MIPMFHDGFRQARGKRERKGNVVSLLPRIPHARYNLLRSRSFGLNLAPSHVLKSLGMQLYFLYELPRGLPCLRRKGESKM